jgi:UDP-3-O-[3-hydroxymyristoyl] glucosamine N-acyltransferase
MGKTLNAIVDSLRAAGLDATLDRDGHASVARVNTLGDAEPGDISFLANPKYARLLETTRATAVIVSPSDATDRRDLTLIRAKDPYAAITRVVVELHGYRKHPAWGGGERPTIHPTAKVGGGANIAAGVTVCEGVEIGARVTLYPGCFIAPRCRLGDDVVLYPNVVLYEETVLGHRVAIHAGSVIGEDGLGYAPVNGKWIKIPQVGQVVVADDVEIGANCTIDRATLGRTTVGRGTKFSNLIAVGHGTKIGEDCMLVAQVGLAGSVVVGDHVTMAGQAGVVGHIKVGDNVTVGAKAGVTNDVEPGVTVLGQPAVPIADCRRQVAAIHRLPEMRQRMRDMEAELQQLREMIESLKAVQEGT